MCVTSVHKNVIVDIHLNYIGESNTLFVYVALLICYLLPDLITKSQTRNQMFFFFFFYTFFTFLHFEKLEIVLDIVWLVVQAEQKYKCFP